MMLKIWHHLVNNNKIILNNIYYNLHMTDIIPAFCVGLTQVSVGHPFDTVKVLMQNNKKWLGLSLKQYYKGWKFPLISATFFNCTVLIHIWM